MIVTVTLNPSLDKPVSVPCLQPGKLQRVQVLGQDLGGDETSKLYTHINELGPKLTDEDACADEVENVQCQRIDLVALSGVAAQLVLALNGTVVAARQPQVKTQSPIGAGDATVSGLLWAIQDGCNATETARRAVVCGTATAKQEGTSAGNPNLMAKFFHQIQAYNWNSF